MKEIPGSLHEPRILRWWRAIGAPFVDDETPWCGAFVGGVLNEAGVYPSHPSAAASARSWLRYGKPTGVPLLGAVAVFWRGSPGGWSGHVGFVVGTDPAGRIHVLGGNQGDEVSVKAFPRIRVLGYRWPTMRELPSHAPIIVAQVETSRGEA